MSDIDQQSTHSTAEDTLSVDELLAPLQVILQGIGEELAGLNKRIDMLGAQTDWLVQNTQSAFAAIQSIQSSGMLTKMVAGLKGKGDENNG